MGIKLILIFSCFFTSLSAFSLDCADLSGAYVTTYKWDKDRGWDFKVIKQKECSEIRVLNGWKGTDGRDGRWIDPNSGFPFKLDEKYRCESSWEEFCYVGKIDREKVFIEVKKMKYQITSAQNHGKCDLKGITITHNDQGDYLRTEEVANCDDGFSGAESLVYPKVER